MCAWAVEHNEGTNTTSESSAQFLNPLAGGRNLMKVVDKRLHYLASSSTGKTEEPE